MTNLFIELLVDEEALCLMRNVEGRKKYSHVSEKVLKYFEGQNLNPNNFFYRGLRFKNTDSLMNILYHGTDRFIGHDSNSNPYFSPDLTPFRNDGTIKPLNADTYAVPDLNWAFAFTELTDPKYSSEKELFPLITLYHASKISGERIPPNGGEQWRCAFKTTPKEALAGIIKVIYSQ